MRAFGISVIVSILLMGNWWLAGNGGDKPKNSSTQPNSSTTLLEPDDPSTGPSAPAPDPAPGTAPQQAAPQGGQSPLSFKIGAAQFTPGGFLDAAVFYRTKNLGSGIATSFGTVPFNNVVPQGHLSETHISAQYSRLSLRVDANMTPSTAVTGYVESDFLGFQPPTANITANSESLRLRVYWADVKHGKWEFLGGQEWSLLQPKPG